MSNNGGGQSPTVIRNASFNRSLSCLVPKSTAAAHHYDYHHHHHHHHHHGSGASHSRKRSLSVAGLKSGWSFDTVSDQESSVQSSRDLGRSCRHINASSPRADGDGGGHRSPELVKGIFAGAVRGPADSMDSLRGGEQPRGGGSCRKIKRMVSLDPEDEDETALIKLVLGLGGSAHDECATKMQSNIDEPGEAEMVEVENTHHGMLMFAKSAYNAATGFGLSRAMTKSKRHDQVEASRQPAGTAGVAT